MVIIFYKMVVKCSKMVRYWLLHDYEIFQHGPQMFQNVKKVVT